MKDNFIVEIWCKNSNAPVILQYNLSLESAQRLYDSAAFGWKKRKIIDGNKNGLIIKEEIK